jgi:hypothetical protein
MLAVRPNGVGIVDHELLAISKTPSVAPLSV